VSVSNLGVHDLRDRPLDNEVTFPDEPYEDIRHYLEAKEAVQALTDIWDMGGHTAISSL
jgi:hypothetical protein